MELLIFVAALGTFGLLALRYGHDSRYGVESKEQTLAKCGVATEERLPKPRGATLLTPTCLVRIVTRLVPRTASRNLRA